MKCEVKELNKCTKELSIEVSQDKINEAYESVYTEIAKTATLPGFRKGKAPKQLIRAQYKDRAKEEVLKRLVSDNLYKAVDENKINMFGYPDFSDVDFTDEKLSFTAKVEERPEIEVKEKDYKGLSAKREKIEVKAKEIDEVIGRILDGYAKYKPVEDRGIELGDFAVCDIESSIEGMDPEKKENEWCEIKEDPMMKDFAKQTVGMKPGDQKDIEVTMSKDFPNKEIAGKKAVFNVSVKEIKIKELPELDEEFLKTLGEYKSEDEFKDAVKKDIEARKKSEADAKVERALIDKIDKAVKCDLPESLVIKRLNGMIQETKQNMMYQGMPAEEIDKRRADMEKDFRTEAERQVKVAFILDKIAVNEDIDVEEADLEKKFAELAAQYRTAPQVVREHYEKQNMIDQLKGEVRNQKVIDMIVENAQIK